MATKVIPEQREVTCDACGAICHSSLWHPGRRRQQGIIQIYKHGLDMVGDPCCDGSTKYELCDACLKIIEDGVTAGIATIKASKSAVQ